MHLHQAGLALNLRLEESPTRAGSISDLVRDSGIAPFLYYLGTSTKNLALQRRKRRGIEGESF
jgi:hypothetical protein